MFLIKNKYVTTLLAFIICLNAFLLPVYASEGYETIPEALTINPYALTQAELPDIDDYTEAITGQNEMPDEPEIYSGAITPPRGLSPYGTGTVVDNVITQNEIEFFTVYTEEGNVFFLVVDRKSNTDNVHLLNAVTEADLMALAERSGIPIELPYTGAIPPIGEITPQDEYCGEYPQTQDTTDSPPVERSSNSNFLLIFVVVLAVGGAAYYFKIVRPKQNAVYDDDDDFDEPGTDDDDNDDESSDDDDDYKISLEKGGEDE